MPKQKKFLYNHPQIGEIELLPNTRCRGIRYSVSHKGAKISFNPIYIDKVLPLPTDKEEWFLKNREKFARMYGTQAYSSDSRHITYSFEIIFAEEPKLKNSLSAQLQNGVLTIRYYPLFDFGDNHNQQSIKNIVKHFLVLEAKRILPTKLRTLASRYDFDCSTIRISTAKGRWGSCNSKKQISLSAYLLFLPEYLIDFVIVHELCHTKEMNHGKKFYSELARVYPNHLNISKELKSESNKATKYF